MGVCLSKGHGQHHHGHMLPNDDDFGFCTPEEVSLQYESRNPSGRYSFPDLKTPRISADVGDLGALGSLFYKRGSRSRDATNTSTTTGTSNYISPLDMFLGGVRVRNRVHHVNQLCAGDYSSFASYLASPLLKGFDVHAMEAVAKSYAESAAKAAARDAFVFLEENDMSVVSGSSGRFQDAAGFNAATSSGAAREDSGCDVDDDLAKSGESDEWEEPRKVENYWVGQVIQNERAETVGFSKSSDPPGDEAETNSFNKSSRFREEDVETDRFNKSSSSLQDEDVETDKFNKSSCVGEEEAESNKCSKPVSRFRDSNERGTNERWVSVLNAVQARAKARRRQRRKSCLGKAHGGGPERVQRSGSGRKQKTVRFRIAGLEEGFTDDDIRSGKESEYDQAPLQDKKEVEVVLCSNNNSAEEEIKAAACAPPTALQWPPEEKVADEYAASVERSGNDKGSCDVVAMPEEECDNHYIWQEEEEEDNGGEEEEGSYGKEKIIEAEFMGFSFTSSKQLNGGVREPRLGGGATPLMGPRAAPSADVSHVHHASVESFSSSEYFLPETSFGSSEQLEEEVLLEDFSLPPGIDEDDDEIMSPVNHHLPRAQDEESDDGGADFRGIDRGEVLRQCCSADCGECKVSAAATAFPPSPSEHDGCSNYQPEVPSSSFMKDVSVSSDTAAPPPTIPVGCVVVESRMPDGSRLTPQILQLSEVQLPERGEDNYGFFHARVLRHGQDSSLPPASGSDPNPDVEGGFSFPVLFQPSTSIPSSESSSAKETEQRGGALWRAPPLGDPETPIKNRSIRPHLPLPLPPPPLPLLPPSMSTIPVRQIHEINSSPPICNVSDDSTTTTISCDPRGSFSFDTEQAAFTKKTHKIVLPAMTSRSMSPSPVFSPSKVTPSLRPTVAAAAAAAASAPFLSAIQVASMHYPPRARRTLNRKLKFYSLERASYAAAGAKRSNSSKSPPSFSRQYRERRRDTDGESDSDLFEIETMSGTNAMGSSRTPPSTPTKSPRKWTAPAPVPIDLDKLSDSIARVSRSRSKRSTSSATGKILPAAQLRDPKMRCLPVERRKDSLPMERRKDSSAIFEGRGGATIRNMPHSSLKGRALLKLGLLMRNTKQYPHVRSDFRKDAKASRGSSDTSVSEYLENRPPSPPGGRYHHPHGQCGQCLIEEERAAAANNHNYAFEWYCSSMAQRVAPVHYEKRLQPQQGYSSHKSFSNEDRTFAVKN